MQKDGKRILGFASLAHLRASAAMTDFLLTHSKGLCSVPNTLAKTQ